MSQPFSLARRVILVAGLASGLMTMPALAADPAESFVNDNIHKGLDILNSKSLSKQQKADQFEQFLTTLTDMKRIATFTLGQYVRTAPPGDVAAFQVAFQNFAVAIYQSYFNKYAGQSLKVTNSTLRAPADYVVTTALMSPGDTSGQQPLEVAFRVRTDGSRPVVTDFSVEGVWMMVQERDQFVSFLGQNNGNVKLLISHLSDLAKQFK